jgi:hypothetical protein
MASELHKSPSQLTGLASLLVPLQVRDHAQGCLTPCESLAALNHYRHTVGTTGTQLVEPYAVNAPPGVEGLCGARHPAGEIDLQSPCRRDGATARPARLCPDKQ